jgi:hypothetical protein
MATRARVVSIAHTSYTWYVDPDARMLGGTFSHGDVVRYVAGKGEEAGCDTTDHWYESVDLLVSHCEKVASPL